VAEDKGDRERGGRFRKDSDKPPQLGKNPPAGAGRSATCRRCTDSGSVNLCSCLVNCGHRLCTGAPAPGTIEPVYPKENPKLDRSHNPTGKGPLGRNQYRKSPRLKPPKYDGPKGDDDKRPKGWRRGKRA
jgi:hypothetical protein